MQIFHRKFQKIIVFFCFFCRILLKKFQKMTCSCPIFNFLRKSAKFCKKIVSSLTKSNLNLTAGDVAILKKLDSKIVVGKVSVISNHPDPKITKVRVAKVEISPKKFEQILCGGVNLRSGDIVPVATIGANLGDNFVISEREIRGEISRGMICARSELGISVGNEKSGEIWKLPANFEQFLGRGLYEVFS